MMAVTCSVFGMLDGVPVHRYCIRDTQGIGVAVLTLGATLQALWIPDRTGVLRDLLPGYDTLDGYITGHSHFGAMIGRCSNRISGAAFTLNDKTYRLSANEDGNHLHGGFAGFERKLWAAQVEDEETVCLTCHSPDGEEGYPGNLRVELRVRFDAERRLTLDLNATSDADTLCSLTTHAYFNLNGQDGNDVLDHHVQISAARRQYIDPVSHLPDGRLCDVDRSPYDLRMLQPLQGPDGPRLQSASYLLDGTPAAVAWAPATGIGMRVETTLPAMLFYTGYLVKPGTPGKSNGYGPYCGLCFETQFPVDAIHQLGLPQPVLRAGERWHHTTTYAFWTGT